MKTLELTKVGEHYMEGGLYKDKDGKYYVDCYHEPKDDGVSTVFILSPSNDPDGEPNCAIQCHIRILNPLTESEKKQKLFQFEYMMLSRLNDDAAAYFGRHGNEKDDKWDCRYHNANFIWGHDISVLVEEMKKLWQKIPSDIKPEWCTWEQILEYERIISA